ncbi:MAG: DegV family protein [Lachnospiraceae bacterium]
MVRIISDSASDITKEFAAAHNIEIITLYITFDGTNFFRDKDEVDTKEFYYKMVEEHAYPKSSLPSVDDYYQIFKNGVEAGDEIICMCITNSLSGSYNSAMTAYQMIIEDYPDAKLSVYNSWQNTISQALLVYQVVRMRDDGLTYEQMISKMDALRASGRIFFTVQTLEYLKKGGRIGKLLVHGANLLNIKPLLILSNGDLGLGGISRSRKKAKDAVLAACKNFIVDGHLNTDDFEFAVGYGNDREEGEAFLKEFEEFMGITCIESRMDFPSQIGAITACHTGPHALGVGFVAKYETL